MIPLQGRATVSNWRRPASDVWRVAGDGEGAAAGLAVRVTDPDSPPRVGADLYISYSPDLAGPGPTIHLPEALSHVAPDDVLVISDDGRRVQVGWKNTATHNSVLLTERCDNYCLMCSQPPKDRDDSYLYGRAKRIVSALPDDARALTFTGGEPTIQAEAFLDLLQHCARQSPHLAVHVLSNGRKFADKTFAHAYADAPLHDLMVGIPLYSSESALHDFIVQSPGAFDETVRGILNLAAHGARIEIRVVVQRHTVPALTEIAIFIARNLPFVEQVALMGLEVTGLAKPNLASVWADPADYRTELRHAYEILTAAGIFTRIYNHQLCVLDTELWPAAVQSISDWKNEFPQICQPCTVRDRCAGVFTTSGARLSSHLQPVL